jgi:hypothetical protein
MGLLATESFLTLSGTSTTGPNGWAYTSPQFVESARWPQGRWGVRSRATAQPNGATMSATFPLGDARTIVGVAGRWGNGATGIAAEVYFARVTTNGRTLGLRVLPLTATTFQIRLVDSTLGVLWTSTEVFAIGTWYYLELKVDWAAAGGRAVVRIDDDPYYDSGATLALVAPAATALFTFGGGNTSSSVSVTDIIIMDGTGAALNDLQGDVRVETCFAVADGAHGDYAVVTSALASTATSRNRTGNVATLGYASSTVHPYRAGDSVTVSGFTDASFNGTFTVLAVPALNTFTVANAGPDTGNVSQNGSVVLVPSGAHYQVVDERFPNSDVDYVHTAAAGATDTYAMEDAGSASGAVLAVRVAAYARKEAAALHSFAVVARTGGTTYVGTPSDLPATLAYAWVKSTWVTNPGTGVAWTLSDVNGLEAGTRLIA